MKKILGLAAGIMLTAMTFAQSGVSFNDAGASYNSAETTVFHFTFDSNYSAADLNSNATYYTDYFTTTVVAEGTGNIVTFTLVEDTEMARRVISRYFIGLDVQNITAEGTDYSVNDFFRKYMMK